MLDHHDLKWTAANLTDLNCRLQQVSHCAERAQQEEPENEHLQRLIEETAQATKISQAIFDRVTSRILASASRGGAPGKAEPRTFRVVPPAGSSQTGVTTKIPVGEMAASAATQDLFAIRNPSGARELILVVDDEPEILERAGTMLEGEDYRILVAKDGIDALKIYAQMSAEVSLIILDFFLPVMDGDAVFDELKAINPNVQVVLSSGFAEQTKLGSMLARGLCGFIPKPYTSEKLLNQVRSIIAA
ncbi:MAG: response regulator [Chthoniobacterales bacterium]